MVWIRITVASTGVAGRKHEPMQLAFVLYFSLFGYFISLPNQWHWWWSPLFQLKCAFLKTCWRACWQAESLLLSGPPCATCHDLVSLPQREVTWVKASLLGSNQLFVVSMGNPQHLTELKCLPGADVKVNVAHCILPETPLPRFVSFMWCWCKYYVPFINIM